MVTLRIGTRGSRLALIQSNWVANRLRALVAELDVELIEIRTSGDVIRDVPLGPELGSSFFTKEIEDALLDERIDVAVHSCKDLATSMPHGLALAAVPLREDARDVLVSSGGALSELPAGATVGTSSPRRKGFLAIASPELVIVDQRGNVPTRVAAVDEGRVDAVVLAAAGLARLGMTNRVTEYFRSEVVLPAAAQGALALQVRQNDEAWTELVGTLDDADSHSAVMAERACLHRLGAGCQAPVGALARVESAVIEIEAAVVTPMGIVRTTASGTTGDSDGVGTRAAEDLLAAIGLESLRAADWAGPPPRDVGAAR